MDKLAELAERYGPHVIDAAREAVMIEVYQSFIGALICLAISAVLLYVAVRLDRARRLNPYDNLEILETAAALFAAILAIPIIWTILDPWTWAAVYHPDLWIAKKVLHL